MDSSTHKRKPVDTLTYDNWEEWFYLFQEWSKGEGIGYVLQKTVRQYAYHIAQPFNGFGTGTTPSTGSSTAQTPENAVPRPIEVRDLLEGLKIIEEMPLQGYWDVARLEKWSKAEARIRYTITICVNDIDSKALKKHDTMKEGWESLKAKYSRIPPATAREFP